MTSGTPYPVPDLSDLATALAGGETDLALGGVVPSARGLVVAALAAAGWRPGLCLLAVPNLAEVSDAVGGIELLAPGLRVAAVPAECASPYSGVEPPLAARLELVRLLDRVGRGEVDVLVAPVRTLLQRIPEPEEIAAQRVRIIVGDRIDPLGLARRLSTLGYRRVDLVEEAGELALRGWVIDVHPGGEHAVRVELDDDRVESLRFFDPDTQRSVDRDLGELLLLPLDPFPALPERVDLVAEELERDYTGLAGYLRQGAERRLWWGTLALVGGATGWLEVAETVVACDRDEVTGEMARWERVQEREWTTLSSRTVDLPGPDRLLLDGGVARARIEGAALRIERLEVAGGPTR